MQRAGVWTIRTEPSIESASYFMVIPLAHMEGCGEKQPSELRASSAVRMLDVEDVGLSDKVSSVQRLLGEMLIWPVRLGF